MCLLIYIYVRTCIEIGKSLSSSAIVVFKLSLRLSNLQDDAIQQELTSVYQEIKIMFLLAALEAYRVCKI